MHPPLRTSTLKEDEPTRPLDQRQAAANAMINTQENPKKKQEWDMGNPPNASLPRCPEPKKETGMNK
jgi:hypothetical protein